MTQWYNINISNSCFWPLAIGHLGICLFVSFLLYSKICSNFISHFFISLTILNFLYIVYSILPYLYVNWGIFLVRYLLTTRLLPEKKIPNINSSWVYFYIKSHWMSTTLSGFKSLYLFTSTASPTSPHTPHALSRQKWCRWNLLGPWRKDIFLEIES